MPCNNPRIICRVPAESYKQALWDFRLFVKDVSFGRHILSRLKHVEILIWDNLKIFPNYKYYTEHSVLSRYFFRVPCNKCLGCLADKRNQWASRCILEAKQYKHNCFVTLTYNDKHVPPALVRKDYQDFFKRLRSALKVRGLPSPREFYRGEYGERFSRPHFHFIGFNLDFPDKRVLYYLYKGQKYKRYVVGSYPVYTSQFLEDVWGKGFVTVEDVNMQNIKYVANYLDKGRSPAGHDSPPFHGWSNRPALGRSWFDSHFKIGDIDSAFEVMRISSCKLPCRSLRYFRTLVKKLSPLVYAYVADMIVAMARARPPLWNELGISEYEYLQRREQSMQSALEKFGRKRAQFY